MTLCELEATGFFGWPDVVSWLTSATLIGAWLGSKLGRYMCICTPTLKELDMFEVWVDERRKLRRRP